jgi:hypothetical protein
MKDKKYTFTIPIFKTVTEDIIVEASSLEEAMEKAINMPSDSENPGECCDIEVQEEINKEVLEEIEIDNTPDKDLPLLLNKEWSTEEIKNKYTSRLKGGD